MKNFFVLLFLLVSFSAFAQFDDEYRIQNEFIFMLKPTHHIEDFLTGNTSLKIKKCLSPRMNIWLLERNSTAASEDFLAAIQKNEHVKLAQFNHHVQQRSIVPNDTFFNLQWNMQNTGQSGGVVGSDIDATDAWGVNHNNVTVNGDTIVIAIIDETFDLHHEDINYFINYGEIPGNGIDDDGNGFIDDYEGYNFDDTSGNVNSSGFDAQHSTHCAGIAAAKGNNTKGVAGVCWGAKILPIAATGLNDLESEVIEAYNYVITMRALYNNSFGTQGAFIVSTNSSFGVGSYGANPADYPIWCAMYDSMGYYGILSAAAGPNSPVNVDVVHDVPTQCPSKWMIGVTNMTRSDVINSGAAFGKISVDLGAPGTGIESTVPPSSYGGMTGTSMATPHVAGTVAAMFAGACKGLVDFYYERPDSVALLMKQYLLSATQWNSSLNNVTSSNGKLNLYRALLNVRSFNCDSCTFTPYISQSPIACKGVPDGMLSVNLNSGNINNDTVVWSTGSTSPVLSGKGPGFYTVTVSDITGCQRFASAELHDPDTIKIITINTIPATDSTQGNIIINAKSGNDPLLYSIDGTHYQQTTTFSIPSNGSYTVYIKNSEGCIVQQQIVVSGLHEIQDAGFAFNIYPNPASNTLNISINATQMATVKFSILNILGETISSEIKEISTGGYNATLNLAPVANGIYFLQLNSANTSVTRKFVVEKN